MTVPRTPEQLAERVMRLIDRYTGAPWMQRAYADGTLGAFESGQEAKEALDALLARLQAAERERDGLRVKANGWVQHDTEAYAAQSMRALKRAEAAEARVKELEVALAAWRSASPPHRYECNPLDDTGCTCGLQAAREATGALLAASRGTPEAKETE